MKAFEKNIRKVEPYVPGEQPQNKVVKLNTNENPYPPAPGVEKALGMMDMDRLRLYPDPTAAPLVKELAKFYDVNPDQVFVGVGSDDVLSMCFLTFFNSEKPILFPDITYSFYKVWADLYRIPYECQKLDENFRIRKEDYYKENGGVIFPNPNAPTAIYEELDMIENIITKNQDVIVIIDEAYVDFSNMSARTLIDKYDNVLIVQTYSKSRSLAGMRIGHAMGNPELIAAMNDVRFSYNSYPMTRLSVEIGAAAIEDTQYFEQMRQKVIATREWTKKELTRLGFSFGDSMTNFIFATHERVPAQVIFDKLREKHIFVRHFSSPRIENYLRISIGTDEEMKTFIEETEKIISEYQ